MVFYRKYRPQKISELDLPQVREKLTAILSSEALPHAFLFTGSKGLGKTSAARIVAKAINCTGSKEKNIEPCNKCDSCVSITDGSNIDVLEIDAASNGGVEEIRTLREKVKFASSSLKYKVYIIDEVHMLSTGAFNALLKTLEEPPSHVIFILATTELWKLPATVVSRTFQVLFEKPAPEDMVRSLSRIAKGEDIKIEKKALEEIGKLSDGSFRDGAKILEELTLSSKGEEITKELLDTVFKTKGVSENILDLLKAYEMRDAKKALETISRLTIEGADFKIVIERLVDHLRGLLMMRNSIESSEKDVPGLDVKDIKELLELSNEAYAELRLSIIPQLPLELMSVKFCVLDGDTEKVKKNESLSVPTVKKEESEVSKEVREPATKEINNESAKNILFDLIKTLNETNKPGAALLRSCKDALLSDNDLTITTPFPIHAERLKSENVLSDLKKAAEVLIGDKVELHIKILAN